jgi:hypothetical protein
MFRALRFTRHLNQPSSASLLVTPTIGATRVRSSHLTSLQPSSPHSRTRNMSAATTNNGSEVKAEGTGSYFLFLSLSLSLLFFLSFFSSVQSIVLAYLSMLL